MILLLLVFAVANGGNIQGLFSVRLNFDPLIQQHLAYSSGEESDHSGDDEYPESDHSGDDEYPQITPCLFFVMIVVISYFHMKLFHVGLLFSSRLIILCFVPLSNAGNIQAYLQSIGIREFNPILSFKRILCIQIRQTLILSTI